MKRCMTVPALLLCLLLTACGGGETGQGRDSFWEELGVEETEVLLTVDGREVPAWRYCRWLAAACEAITTEYEAAGAAVDWGAAVEDGTLDEYACRRALEDTVLYATVENWAEQVGVTVEEEPAGDPASLLISLSEAQAAELDRVGLLYVGLCSLAQQENSPLVTAEELAAWGTEQGYMAVDRIFFAAGEDRDAARQRAEEAFAQLNRAGEKGPLFDSLAASGDDLAGPRTLKRGDGTLEETLESAAAALEPEQYSGILETEEGFSVLRRLAVDKKAFAGEWLDKKLLKMAEEAEVLPSESVKVLTAQRMAAVMKTESR